MEDQVKAAPDIFAAFLRGEEVPVESRWNEETIAADTFARQKAYRTVLWEKSCPDAFKASNWDHPDLRPYRAQIDRVRAWNVGPKGMLIAGPTGRGKSRSLWALMERLMCIEARDVRVWRSVDWFAALQGEVNYGRDEASHFVRSTARRPVLVMDDLGQEALTKSREDWARSWFFAMLDERLGANLPIIVTTNMNADQIAGNKANIRGEPLLRRLLEMCEVIRFQ